MSQGWMDQIADTSQEDGDELAVRLNRFDLAAKSNQLGTTRPTGIATGGIWTKDNGDGTYTLHLYDGAIDRPILLTEFLVPRRVEKATASNSVDYVCTTFSSNARKVIVDFGNLIPAVDGGTLMFRSSSDGGVTEDSGASDYAFGIYQIRVGAADGNSKSAGTTQIELSGSVGNAAGEDGLSGTITVYNPGASKKTIVGIDTTHENGNGDLRTNNGGGWRAESNLIDAFRIFFDNGNILSGEVTVTEYI